MIVRGVIFDLFRTLTARESEWSAVPATRDELEGAKAIGLRAVFVSGAIRELWPERIERRCAVADHHVGHAWGVERLVSSDTELTV